MKKKLLSLFLVVSFLFSISIFPSGVSAKTTKQELKDVKNKINTKKDNLNGKQNTADNISNEIKSVDGKIEELTNTISSQEKKQTKLTNDLSKTKKELKKSKEDKIKYQNSLKSRMETMYMYGDTGYLDLIFSSEDFSDLISKIITVQSLVSYDRGIIANLQKAENDIKVKTNKIESDKKELDSTIASLKKNKEDLDILKIAKNSQLENVTGDIDDLKNQIASLEAEKAALDSKIAAESASKGEDYNNSTSSGSSSGSNGSSGGGSSSGGGGSSSGGSSSSNTGKGVLGWPVPGHYNITSYFGPRDQPTAGASTNHGAVDIGVSTGTAVKAPANGKVTTAGWYGGYGYAVGIDCGNINGDHITVLLAHNSRVTVSVGQRVKRGQLVAYSGSTGISTGPHLHFAVYKNGRAVDPLDYVKI
ncbi:peptidoglycan DD-metalloendopeptidase family protein [Anaerofustis sp.]|uniref:murein hydrolase activator EnvC family protein n=1 Tax=Anaerofustis sp. TaxID=1872517 RepID=UPI0025BECC7A|nr:peptidoglycan DD-metalloendopeptidase family protein [Anaerofustis sp.]